MTNSNLLIAALDFVCDNYLKNKNIFIDKNLEMLLIMLIFDVVKGYQIHWVVPDEEQETFSRLKAYYTEYKKYFALLR